MIRIEQLDAWEVLDSRGRPTVAATMAVEPGVRVSISIPSGASTGKAEAQELRDGGRRFGGFGCRAAVTSIVGPISAAIVGESFADQEQLDTRLCELDGTRTKSRLGANAILAISLAFARAVAKVRKQELFDYFGSLLPESPPAFPQLSINLFSGGKHAFGQVAIQDLLVVPSKLSNIADQLAVVYDVYQNAAAIASKRYQSRALTADEGGLAPPLPDQRGNVRVSRGSRRGSWAPIGRRRQIGRGRRLESLCAAGRNVSNRRANTQTERIDRSHSEMGRSLFPGER
jgi:enolase 1/2/3